jgi:hypothetical protein
VTNHNGVFLAIGQDILKPVQKISPIQITEKELSAIDPTHNDGMQRSGDI